MKFQTHINAALICMGIVLAGIVQADVPHKINYQGVLKDDNGVKIDATVDIDLRLLELGGGAEVFSESHTGVSVVGGLFSLKIGGVEDLSEVVFDAAYELELTVGGELMSPNVPLCSAPYALGVAGGAQGPQGKVGPAGADGGTGADGTAGAAGAQGPQGPQGKQGDAGPVGSEFWDASGNDIHNTNSGNVGIGGQSQPIHSAVVNISLGGNATISADKAPSVGAVLDVAQNAYFNTGAAWTKMSNDESSRYRQGGGAHTFYTAPSGTGAAAESVVMALTNDGKVGAGTGSGITETLTVMGNILLRDDGGSKHTLIRAQGSNTNIQSERATSSKLRLETPAGGGITVWGQGGGQGSNVGIGTDDPSAKLHVVNGDAVVETAGNTIASITARAATVEAQLIGDDTTGYSNLNFTYSMSMHQIGYGTPRLRIENGGNVGIGIQSPVHKLDVAGNIQLSNSAPKLLINDSAESANGRMWQIASDNGYLRFQASRDDFGVNSSFLELYRSGASADRTNIGTRLGVGFTGAFSETLEVAGTGNITGDLKVGSFLTIGADKHIRTFQGHTLTINSNWDRFPKDAGDGLFLQTQGGHVSIGAATAPGATLHVYGDIIATGTITPSDARLKENVMTVSAALETVTQLRGVTFNWREDSEHRIGKVPEDKQIGMIAQEVEAVIPDAVHTALDGYKGVNYQSLTGLLIEAIKELRAQNETLKADVEELKKSMN